MAQQKHNQVVDFSNPNADKIKSASTTNNMAQHFSSVDEAVKLLKLDKRHKWKERNGELSYLFWYTEPCSGCSCDCSDGHGCNHGNSGCHECGYTGKRRNVVPVPAFMPDGSPVKVVLQK